MTTHQQTDDRRQTTRHSAAHISVAVRPRGRLTTLGAEAVDFNRYGIAVYTDQPLDREQCVFLTLACGDVRVSQLVGIVHNCVRQGDRFRCGIRFRLSSGLQRDRSMAERRLSLLETVSVAADRRSA